MRAGGALIMAFKGTLKAPHGGIFAFFAIENLVWFLVALAAGSVVGVEAVIAAKQVRQAQRRAGGSPCTRDNLSPAVLRTGS